MTNNNKHSEEPSSQIEQFNAVIEGSYPSPWKDLFFKLANLSVPPEAGKVNDGTYTYLVVGSTDFRTVGNKEIYSTRFQQIPAGLEPLVLSQKETMICGLDHCEGVVLSYHEGVVVPYVRSEWVSSTPFPKKIARPRAFCLEDGRVFVSEEMLHKEQAFDYLKDYVPRLLEEGGRLLQLGCEQSLINELVDYISSARKFHLEQLEGEPKIQTG